MDNSEHDDMDRKGNKAEINRSTAQGQGGNFNQGTTDPVNQDRAKAGNRPKGDPVNLDRAMNRDQEMGQGSSGTEQGRSGKPGITGKTDE